MTQSQQKPLVENLPLVDLMFFANYAKQREISGCDRTNYGNTSDRSASTFEGRIRRLEACLGTFLLRREVSHPLTGQRLAFRPGNQEELEWIHSQYTFSKKSSGSRMTSDLTLDGQIWAAFGQAIFTLFDLTASATQSRDVGVPAAKILVAEVENERIAGEAIASTKVVSRERKPGFGRIPAAAPRRVVAQRDPDVAEREIPSRHHPYDRQKYAIWLSHQAKMLTDAWVGAQETSVFDLIFQLPGFDLPLAPLDNPNPPNEALTASSKLFFETRARLEAEEAEVAGQSAEGPVDHLKPFDPLAQTKAGPQIRAVITEKRKLEKGRSA